MLGTHRISELPDDAAVPGDLEGPPARRLGDQGVAVRQALLRPARLAFEGLLEAAGVAPDDAAVVGVDLQDAGAPALLEAAEVVVQRDVAVRQHVGIVLADPAAAHRPDALLGIEIEHGDGVDVAERPPELAVLGNGQSTRPPALAPRSVTPDARRGG